MDKRDMIQVARGCVDIFGDDIVIWQHIENILKQTCENFCVDEIRTPVFEYTEVFKREVDDTSDMVEKEMYTFYDKGLRSITLKPEGTASVVRSFCENNFANEGLPKKVYYITSCFRYENPAAGRQRQFHQFGIEYFGADTVSGEAEIIALVTLVFKNLGIEDIELHINSLGDKECRKNYNDILKNFLIENEEHLCPICKERMVKNPLRVLDCKEKSCQNIFENAPKVLDTLGEECKKDFDDLLKKLDMFNIKYVIDKSLVRGLDYYNNTVFEFVSTNSATGGTICGGGRYDYLVEEFGGPKTKCVGFGMGLERLVLLYKSIENTVTKPLPIIYIGSIGELGQSRSEEITFNMRSQGFKVECNISKKSVKAQMKYADKINCTHSLILGDNEVMENILPIRNMETGETTNVIYDEDYIDNMINIFF
ncbi:MAG: histidine--tRNA ligase [Lachnospirales bacterium]